MSKRRAFTLIELLVVVAIIGALIAILIPSIGRAKQLAKRTVCATNLKGQGNAFAIYAAQENDALPFITPSGNWLHDMNSTICDTLVGSQMKGSMSASSVRKWFYCPTNFDANSDNAWYGIQVGQSIPNPPPVPPFRWLDYAYFNARNCATPLPVVRDSQKAPKIAYKTKYISTPMATDAELAVDELITSSRGGNDYYVPNSNSYFHEYSSHLKGKVPEGQNVLACDGHVSWRGWPKAQNQKTWVPQGSATANDCFIIIDP